MAAQALFTMKALAELDNGKVAEQLESSLRQAGIDCLERPGEKRVRKVNLQVELKPIADEKGDLDRVNATFQIKTSLPTRTTTVYQCDARKTGQLVFKELYPEEADE